MKTLKSYFRDFFGMELPREFLYQGEDRLHGFSHEDTPEPDLFKACMVANDIAVNHDLLPVATEVPESIYQGFPEGYYVMGFHEYGFFNRWFYFVRVDDWRRIFIRIPYGPNYNLEGGSNVYGEVSNNYLLGYLKFVRRLKGKLGHLQVQEDPYISRYKIIMPDGQEFKYQGNEFSGCLVDDPDFETVFSKLWPVLAAMKEGHDRDNDLGYRQMKLLQS